MSDSFNEMQGALRTFLLDLCSRDTLRASMVEGDLVLPREFYKSRFVEPLKKFGIFELVASNDLEAFPFVALASFETGYSLLPIPLGEYLFFGPFLCRNLLPSSPYAIGSVLCCGAGEGAEYVRRGARLAEYSLDWTKSLHGHAVLSITPIVDDAEKIVSTCDPLSICSKSAGALEDIVVKEQGEVALSVEHLRSARDFLQGIEALGACMRAIDDTLIYLRTRYQFGVSVGGFQAVQQQVADAYAHVQALYALGMATSRLFEQQNSQCVAATHAFILKMRGHARRIIETMIQCQGGIGFTWESSLHLSLRRVVLLEALWSPSVGRSEGMLEAIASLEA
jgi:Acyl-CoA dehydrogenase, C-terminal domain